MEVTQSSKYRFSEFVSRLYFWIFLDFLNILPEIEDAIKNCTFVSIDCELTGLKTALNHVNAFDTPKKYYEMILKDCKEFLLIQYGLTFFR